MLTSAFTAATYAAVLSQTCLAVGLSTIAPATFVELVRIAKIIANTPANSGTTPPINIDEALDRALAVLPPLPGMPKSGAPDYANAIKPWKDVLRNLAKDSKTLHLLVPNKATIDAEFACSGSESYGMNAGVEGVLQVVGVKAGYSALFEVSSSTSVKLHMEFAPVEFQT